MDLNKVMIIGRLTRDPEVRTTPNGKNVAVFSVATGYSWTDQQGQKKEQTEFHNVVAWGKLATQEFDAFGMSFPYVSAGDALNLYFRSANTPTPNRMNWKDKETDELLDKGSQAIDPAVRTEAYAAVQKSYKALAKQIGEDNRLDTAAAVTNFEAMIKACIDHKSNVTTGGHNIMIDVIPNDIAARCLDMGRAMLDEETRWLTTDPDKERAHFSP